jgi:hypothetical protein
MRGTIATVSPGLHSKSGLREAVSREAAHNPHGATTLRPRHPGRDLTGVSGDLCPPSGNIHQDQQEALGDLISAIIELEEIKIGTDMDKPTVVT